MATIYGTQGNDQGRVGIWGTPGDDFIYGFAGDDNLYGRGGNDELFGGQDNDNLYGELGRDTLDGGAGVNLLAGGDDNDTYILRNDTDTILEYSGGGNDDMIHTRLASTDMRSYNHVENLIMTTSLSYDAFGNNLANTITGNGNDNTIFGRLNADTLEGAGGNDELDGGKGYDYISGGPGDDYIVGGDHADVIIGSTGKDTLLGDNGPSGTSYAGDEFRYFSTQDSPFGAANRDLIFDFDPGMDFIDLSLIDANVTLPGNQDFEFIGSSNFSRSKNPPPEVRYYTAGTSVIVQVQVKNFAIGPDMEIEIHNVSSLSASDFLGVAVAP
jgi:Ca2+-binding RTX toxin-like protein